MSLYTIGYEGLSPAEFLNWLKRYKINVIADVRRLPLSRKKGFSKNSLGELLTQNNVKYVNFPELGTTKKMRSKLVESGDYKSFSRKYKYSLKHKIDQLNELHGIINSGKSMALLCYEHDAQRCHRKILADTLKKIDRNGLQVEHIKPF